MDLMRGWLVSEASGVRTAALTEISKQLLEDQEFSGASELLRVEFSTLNYKDALAVEGKPGVLRQVPLVPGIDAAGTLSSGKRVVVSGAGLGEDLHGGLAQFSRVPREACIELPEHFSPLQAAAVGTAGFTAALSVLQLERHGVAPSDGPIAVTGASGGVGSIAIALLAAAGFEVHAVSGRAQENSELLRACGASAVLERSEFDSLTRPLAKTRFAGAVDAVGGKTLTGVLASLSHSGVATTCGLAQSAQLPATVLPFILRGVTLAGIDSVRVARQQRIAAWQRIFDTLDLGVLERLTRTIDLESVRSVTGPMLEGRGAGRTVVAVS